MGDVGCDHGGERRDIARRNGRREMGLVNGTPVVVIVSGVGVWMAHGPVVIAGVERFVGVGIGDVESPTVLAGVVEHGRVQSRVHTNSTRATTGYGNSACTPISAHDLLLAPRQPRILPLTPRQPWKLRPLSQLSLAPPK